MESKKLKIGFVDCLYATPKGHSYVVRDMVKLLKEAGHETHMYRIGDNPISDEFEMPDSIKSFKGRNLSKVEFIEWIKEKELDYCVFMEYQQWWKEDYDKLQVCKDNGVKTAGFLVWEKLDWDELEHYKLYTSILCPTGFQTKLLRSKGLTNAVHTPWGVFKEEIDSVYMPESREDDKIIFYHCAGSGGVENRKNTDAVIAAYKQIKDETTELSISHLGNKVFGRNEIISFMKRADVLINTAKWDTIGLNCQPKGSMVITNNGTIPIEKIKIGDNVLTHKNKFEPVINILNGKNYIREITSGYTNTLKLTDDHPILAIKSNKKTYTQHKIKLIPKWINASEITPYDFLAVPKPKHIKHHNFLKITDYVDNNNIIQKNGFIHNKYSKNMKNVKISMFTLMKKYNIKKNTMWRILNNITTKESVILSKKIRKEYDNFNLQIPNKIIVDKEFSRLLGLFVAEGWTENNSTFGFAFHTKEKSYHDFVLKTMKDKFNLIGKTCVRGNGTTIQFFNSVISEFFEKLCNKYAYNKDVPNFLLHEKIYLQKEFIKGYFDGDGHYDVKYANASAVTISKNLAYNMKYLLLRCGVLSKITKYKGKKGVKILDNICDTKDFYNIRIAYSKSSCELFKLKYHKPRYKFYLEDENYFYVKVKSIKINNTSIQVYNITVEKDHSYCGEIVLHNSIESNMCGIPVIVVEMDPMTELVKNNVNGFTVPGEIGESKIVTCPVYNVDVDELAKKMQICKNKMVLDTLKSSSRKFAEINFDWNKNKKFFLKHFK